MLYERVQTSPTWLLAGIPIFTVVGIVAMVADGDTGVVILTALVSAGIVAIVAHFSRMRVRVTAHEVQVTFGTRWPRRTVAVRDVRSHAIVRNPWYWGWGIRAIPNGWLWNVWGLDAIELELASGRRFRIGTDDPQGLYASLLGVVGR